MEKDNRSSKHSNMSNEDIHQATINPIHLLFEQQIVFPDKELMLATLPKYFGKLLYFSYDEKAVSFASEKFVAEFKDGKKVPVIVQITCCVATEFKFDSNTLSQMQWSCPKYREILENCKYHIVAFDTFGDSLQDYKKRAELIVQMTDAFIELFPMCKAVLFERSGKMHSRDDILRSNAPEEYKIIDYMVNVRFFNVSGTDDKLIDSLGMNVLRLPDLQYYFHSIDPNYMVNHAYNVLSYIYDSNPQFNPNDTIDGVRDGRIDASEQWTVNYENSLVQPMRLVLNINMGEYASGNPS